MIETLTHEQIAGNYSSAMDSVNLINGGQPATVSAVEWADIVRRNKEHLNIMLSKTYWTTENLGPLKAAAV